MWKRAYVLSTIMIKQPIKFILILENVFGLYRNYVLFGKMQKTLIIVRTVVEVALMLTGLLLFPIISTSYLQMFYRSVTNICFIVLSVSPIYFSEKFTKLLIHFNSFASFFPTDPMYALKTNRLKKIFMCEIIIYISSEICLGIWYYVLIATKMSSEYIFNWITFLFELNMRISYIRFYSEFTVFYYFLSLLAEQIDCIVRSVNAELLKQQGEQHYHVGGRHCTDIQLHLFDKWSAAFATISKISKLCNLVFGIEVASS